ncbi:hypothetical protein [Paludisphaera mucosa]|uniref:Uncharacterized protein n=1 Tax=Paludisphaera mucosa TaxID=3030827 RepID=A0ABT6F8P2_9BACT|nr:hypothetical protein [Paludisphaera mucosa]MDG3003960.1 hypothetical protein [Paludisphaera mucosa]
MNPNLRPFRATRCRVLAAGLFMIAGIHLPASIRAQQPGMVDEPPTLGTFEPTPYIMVGAAAPTSNGYSPLGTFGDTSLSLNGPVSSLRSIAAPVVTYNRGYDGVVRAVPGTSSSTPNLPILSPFVYPTRRSNYYAPRTPRPTPPWWTSGAYWIDQN